MPLFKGPHVTKGTHINYESALLFALEKSPTITAIQIHAIGPRNLKENKINIPELKSLLKKHKIKLVIHSSYMTTAAFTTTAVDKTNIAIETIQRELVIGKELGAESVIIHIPKVDHQHVVKMLKRITRNQPDNIKLLVETPSFKPDNDFSLATSDRINRLIDYIRAEKLQKKVGICIDSAHIFSQGTSFETYKDTMKWLNDIKYPKMIQAVHLNDSESELGSGVDKHFYIGRGAIWSEYNPRKQNPKPLKQSGIQAIVEFSSLHGIPVILEREGKVVRNEIDILDNCAYSLRE